MSLDEKFREGKKFVLRRTPSAEVLDKIRNGKKFIIVGQDFDNNIPLGYMLIDMRYKGESFRTLVPQNLLLFLANPGEGSVDDALDEIGDFYGEIEDFEDELLESNDDSVQGTNWAVTARTAYGTYLINKLTKASDGNADVAVWNEEIIKALDLDDDYVAQRVRAIAAVTLGKTAEQVKGFNLGSVLKHVTINERKVEQLSREEFDKVTCWAGSHYEIKEEYKNDPTVEYRIDRRHDTGHKVGEKITKKHDVPVLDARIGDLEKEIEDHRMSKGRIIGRHDLMLTRTYANLTYIAKEDPQKQLEIKPTDGGKNE